MKTIRTYTPDEDAQLLLSWNLGDRSAFESLVRRYQKRMFNLALQLTGSSQSAEAATLDAFVTAYRDIRSLRSNTRFSSWLAAHVLKECRSRLELPAIEKTDDSPEPPQQTADRSVLGDPLLDSLIRCINDLPVDQKEIILLSYVRSYSLERMTEIFQVSEEFLASRLFAAEEALTACLKRVQRQERQRLPQSTAVASAPHPEIRRHFSAYLYNTATLEIKEQTRAHLAGCGSCRESLAELEWIIQHLQNMPDVEPPPGLPTAIMAQVSATPAKRPRRKTVVPLKLPAVVALVLTAVIGLSAYLLVDRERPVPMPPEPAAATPQPAGTAAEKGRLSFPSGLLPGFFREERRPAARDGGAPGQVPAIPLPGVAPAAPAATPSLPAALPATTVPQGAAPLRRDQEALPNLNPEWGDSPIPRPPAKKAPPVRVRPSETAVTLQVPDPVQAAAEIETAVQSVGGRVTGRAHSNGSDILYTRVDVDRLIDLMTRLGKSGRIQELPQPPDGADGPVELIIKWR